MHCLQYELWQNASIMHWVKSANGWKRVDELFFGSVLRYSPSGYHRYEDLVRFGSELNMALEKF